jgi:uncharacterized protein (TIGR02118 family)
MVKAIHYCKRKPGLAFEEFGSYWRTAHAPIVSQVPGVRRYVQSLPIGSVYQGFEPVYDGVTEVWFDDLQAMRHGLDSRQGRAAHADDANFMDEAGAGLLITHEYVAKDGPVDPAMEKWIVFLKRKPGLEPAAFQSYWREQHGPLAATLPATRRYVQSHLQLSAYDDGAQPRYDGVAAVWLDNSDAMVRAVGSPEYEAIRADELNFLDQASFQLIITNEFVVI